MNSGNPNKNFFKIFWNWYWGGLERDIKRLSELSKNVNQVKVHFYSFLTFGVLAGVGSFITSKIVVWVGLATGMIVFLIELFAQDKGLTGENPHPVFVGFVMTAILIPFFGVVLNADDFFAQATAVFYYLVMILAWLFLLQWVRKTRANKR